MRRYNRQFFISAIGLDGLTTFFLSNLVMLFTFGVLYIVLLNRTTSVAVKSPAHIKDSSDMLLVLGFRLNENALPHDVYRQRLDRAKNYCLQNPDTAICLLGGVTTAGLISEAKAGQAYLLNAGCNHCKIELEEHSRHTLENLYHFRQRNENEDNLRLHLVTSRFHLARSMTLAKGLGLKVEPLAAEDNFRMTTGQILALLKEAYLLHWYHIGRIWSHLTRNKHSLERIS